MNQLPQNAKDLSLAINTIIATWEYNIGPIGEEKSLYFKIEETEKTFKVIFEYVISVTSVPEPERDITNWDKDFFVILKTESVTDLIKYVNDICETVSSIKLN